MDGLHVALLVLLALAVMYIVHLNMQVKTAYTENEPEVKRVRAELVNLVNLIQNRVCNNENTLKHMKATMLEALEQMPCGMEGLNAAVQNNNALNAAAANANANANSDNVPNELEKVNGVVNIDANIMFSPGIDSSYMSVIKMDDFTPLQNEVMALGMAINQNVCGLVKGMNASDRKRVLEQLANDIVNNMCSADLGSQLDNGLLVNQGAAMADRLLR